MKLLTRTELAKHCKPQAGSLLYAGEPGEEFIPLTTEERRALEEVSRANLVQLGLSATDTVLIALNQQGSPAVAGLAEAVAPLVNGVALTGPRGRMRLLKTIKALQPTVLVATPCGVLDFLSRLYMEFNVDPMELDIERIILVGEVASAGAVQRIGSEFETEVSELYCDPFFGAALASRKGGHWQTATPEHLYSAAPDNDDLSSLDLNQVVEPAREIILSPQWSASLKELGLRTGQLIADPSSDTGLYQHTMGEHVLIRGRWVSLPVIAKALRIIDGVAHWQLDVDREKKTLDFASLTVFLNRETLLENPMWASRLKDAIHGVTPVSIDIKTALADVDNLPEKKYAVADHRGHHLGIARS